MISEMNNDNYEKLESEAIKKLKPRKPQMKISGKSNFLLAKLSGQAGRKRRIHK